MCVPFHFSLLYSCYIETQHGTVRDVHMVAFVDSNTGNDIDAFITSELSASFKEYPFNGQQLSTRCIDSPDCAKLLYTERHLENSITNFVVILPLQTGISLLEFQYNVSELTLKTNKTFDQGCGTTTVIKTDRGKLYFVCLTEDRIFIYNVRIDQNVPEGSSLFETYNAPIANTSTARLSNFIDTSLDDSEYICYAYDNRVNCIELSLGLSHQSGVLDNCIKVDKLERVRGPDPIIWARCDDGSTKSFDILSLSSTISTVASSGKFPYICPDGDVVLEVDLDNSFIKYGRTNLQTTPLPGNGFLSDSGICFEVEGATLLAFIDRDEGTYVFDCSTSNFTRLPFQACSVEPRMCKQLLLFESRYLHVREPDGNSLIDTHNNFEVIINHQFTSVEFVAVLSNLERSTVTGSTPFPTRVSSTASTPAASSTGAPIPTPTADPNKTAVDDPTSSDDDSTKIAIIIISSIIAVALVAALAVAVTIIKYLR